ncbi:MAG: type IV pilus twitching motility protein PilT [Acidobacteriota bacterium]
MSQADTERKQIELDQLIKIAVSKGASDLHLKVGALPHARIQGVLTPLAEFARLEKADTVRMASGIMNNRQKQSFREKAELDLSYQIAAVGRFRVNVFHQREATSLVLRVIPSRIQTMAELTLPPVLEKICTESRGMVLVTGTTGSGKSTTLAAMMNWMNDNRALHILTIEDPIEFLHRDKRSFITQREISVDTDDFATALRASLRQDPDAIMVGEMRDLVTVETALHAAETGHLVLSTLHTLDATETINRIIGLFPTHQQGQIRLQLAAVLKAVISMRLMRSEKGRLPAIEVLINTEFIRNCIIVPERTKEISTAIAAGSSQYGMQTFDQSILQHYNGGRITYDEALYYATNPDELKMRIKGIVSSAEAIDFA